VSTALWPLYLASGSFAWSAGIPWPVAATISGIGMLSVACLALLREKHRHHESQAQERHTHEEVMATLANHDSLATAAIVSALRGRRQE
jgi:hypothetical protein